MYEHSRWGVGTYVVVPLKLNPRYSYMYQNSFYAELYGGYGTGDKAWKYGGELQLRFPRIVVDRFGLSYSHDIEKAGQHSFDDYNLFNTTNNSTYFSSTYSAIDRVTASIRFKPTSRYQIMFMLRHSTEMLLFDGVGLLYPRIYTDDANPTTTFGECMIGAMLGKHVKYNLLFGYARNHSTPPTWFGRIVIQYGQQINTFLKNKLSVFAQFGIDFSDDTPLSRRFDISGTAFNNYFFSNTFVTVRPNSFYADAFTHLCMAYHVSKPLWSNGWSSPKPFLQLNAMWGQLRHSTNGTALVDIATGRGVATMAANADNSQIVSLQSPMQGVVEPAAGINGLLRWGVIDMGVAVACQLTPQNAPYHSNNFWSNCCVMLSANLMVKYGKQDL